MTFWDSERRAGLGETLFAVYGVTRGIGQPRVSRNRRGFLQRALNASRKRLRPRLNAGR